MRIALIAAGAGGMYCGSCLRDVALTRALREAGHDVLLIPAYTPLKIEHDDLPNTEIFYGGVNVYLQQHSALFRHTPRWIDGLFDARPLLSAATRGAGDADPRRLVDLTASVLQGEHGRQKKELVRLVRFLRDEAKPDVVNLPNAFFAALAEPIRRDLGVPVVCTLSGEDVFIDPMDPADQLRVKELIRTAAPHIDAFIATSAFYADYMAGYLGVPRDRIRVVPVGIPLDGHHPGPRPPNTPGRIDIGYLARVSPEKGLHVLADAFIRLRRRRDLPSVHLHAAGYLSPAKRPYLSEIQRRITDAGLEADFTFAGELDRAGKIAFLHGLTLFSVPATFLEPKGIYVLEAMASGVPVVQPRRGAFTELLGATGGGLLYDGDPHDPDPLADALYELVIDEGRRTELAHRGGEAVHRLHSAARMAAVAVEVYASVMDARG
jgi:glycosyltransferase involved in cell wall biosynthesis